MDPPPFLNNSASPFILKTSTTKLFSECSVVVFLSHCLSKEEKTNSDNAVHWRVATLCTCLSIDENVLQLCALITALAKLDSQLENSTVEMNELSYMFDLSGVWGLGVDLGCVYSSICTEPLGLGDVCVRLLLCWDDTLVLHLRLWRQSEQLLASCGKFIICWVVK